MGDCRLRPSPLQGRFGGPEPRASLISGCFPLGCFSQTRGLGRARWFLPSSGASRAGWSLPIEGSDTRQSRLQPGGWGGAPRGVSTAGRGRGRRWGRGGEAGPGGDGASRRRNPHRGSSKRTKAKGTRPCRFLSSISRMRPYL